MQNLGQDSPQRLTLVGNIPLGGQKMSFGSGPGRRSTGLWWDGNRLRSTLANASVSGATGSLSLMTPRIMLRQLNLKGRSGLPIARHNSGKWCRYDAYRPDGCQPGHVWLNSNNSCAGTSNCEYRVTVCYSTTVMFIYQRLPQLTVLQYADHQ